MMYKNLPIQSSRASQQLSKFSEQAITNRNATPAIEPGRDHTKELADTQSLHLPEFW